MSKETKSLLGFTTVTILTTILASILLTELAYIEPQTRVVHIVEVSVDVRNKALIGHDIDILTAEESKGLIGAVEVSKSKTDKPKVVSRGNHQRKSFPITDEERSILYRITEAEATGGDFDQKANVAQCVINRVEHYNSNVKDVVFAKNQFSPVWDGRYYSVEITQGTIDAVDSVIDNPNRHDAQFFQAYYSDSRWFRTLKFEFEDGIHRYYN